MNSLAPNSFLFDMDGVLMDSMPFHVESWQKAFLSVGVHYPEDRIYQNEGRPGEETILDVYKWLFNTIPDQQTIEKIYAKKTQIMKDLGQAELIKGMDKVVEYLADKSYKLCIVTGSSQESLLELIDNCFNSKFGNNIVTGKDVTQGKPHPEPYLKAIKLIKSSPKKAVVIENSPLGIQSAKKAGIFTLAINTGPLNNSVLKDAGADEIFNSADALLNWLKIRF